METDRPSRADGPYSPKHSTGGFLGGRAARVVATGLVLTAGVVGVVSSTGRERPEQVQVLPPVVSSAPAVTTAIQVEPTAAVTAAPSPDVVVPTSEVTRTPVAQPRTSIPSTSSSPASTSPTSSSPPPPTPSVAPPDPTAPTTGPGRVLLRETVQLPDLPPGWDVPTGSTSLQIPLPDPVTVTGEVTSPVPDQVQVEITIGRRTRTSAD